MSKTTHLRGGRWRNWSGSVRSRPHELVMPTSIEDLARRVADASHARRRLRVVGAGHSFTPLVQTDDILMSLDTMQGIISADEARGTVTVLGGTRLFRLGEELHARNVAQENLGDINQQSIAGAISTSTHGTGTGFGSISTQVAGLTLVTANGDVVECSPKQNPEIFQAARVSVGLLGVIAAVTLRVVPAKKVRLVTRRERLSSVLEHLDDYKRDNTHFEFYWFPYTDGGQSKFVNETDDPVTKSNLWAGFNKIVLENGALKVMSEISRIAPPLAPRICKISLAGITPVNEVNYSHRIYATPRMVRFQEMEYSIPAQHFPAVMAEVRERIAKNRYKVNFPIECRFVKGDDIWLSTAYGRDSAYIAAHMYRGMPYQDYFAGLEEIYTRYDGRPHWGKIHTRDAAYLAAHYPHWDDFRRVRAQLDPQGVFANDYLRTLFAIDTPAPATITPLQEASHE
jgi:FAD-linked oxidoreductase